MRWKDSVFESRGKFSYMSALTDSTSNLFRRREKYENSRYVGQTRSVVTKLCGAKLLGHNNRESHVLRFRIYDRINRDIVCPVGEISYSHSGNVFPKRAMRPNERRISVFHFKEQFIPFEP